MNFEKNILILDVCGDGYGTKSGGKFRMQTSGRNVVSPIEPKRDRRRENHHPKPHGGAKKGARKIRL